MKLDLNKLEEQVDATILNRGKVYFEEGAVLNLEEFESGTWYAVVEGTEPYEVEIHQDKNKIHYFDCSCPYDQGPVCKHVVATLYAIRESKTKRVAAPKSKTVGSKPIKAPTTKKMVQEILDNVSFQELKAFLQAYALKKNEFGSMLLARFSEHTGVDGKEKYALIIDNAFKAGADRTGFVDYANRAKVLKPMQELVDQAKNLFARKHYSEVVFICQTIIEKFKQHADNLEDTSGKFEETVEMAFSLLMQLVKEPVPAALKDSLFDYSLAEFPQASYHELQLADHWLELVDKLAIDKAKEDKLIRTVRELLQKEKEKRTAKSKGSKNDVFFSGVFKQIFFVPEIYEEKRLTLFLVNFLNSRNRRQEADTLIENNKHFSEFREMLIKRALADKQFIIAKKYVQEILASDRKTTSVDENRWNLWLLQIAEQEQDIPGVQQQARKLYLNTYQPEYLLKLKQYYAPEAWTSEYEKIIQPLLQGENKQSWLNSESRLIPTYIALQDWSRLFHYISKKPSLDLLMETSTYLPKSFSPQLLEIFRKAVQEYAANNATRTSYKNVAKALNQMLLLADSKPVVQKMLDRFRTIYKKRFAMIEELNKVKLEQ